jgi:hypothetical protein
VPGPGAPRAVAVGPPRVEPVGRDAVPATERRDLKAAALRDDVVDEGEAVAFRALQNRMAFLRGHAPL